jgi:RNA polymerase sigma-70 factor (ECF subfamily)
MHAPDEPAATPVELERSFAAALCPALQEQARAASNLSLLLNEIVEQARSKWPEVELDPCEYVGFVASRLPEKTADLRGDLYKLCLGDLWLAAAAIAGEPNAINELRSLIRSVASRSVRALRLDDDLAQDVEQALQERLMVGSLDRPAALSRYRGEGSLRSWLRVAALREAMRQRPPLVDDHADPDDLFVQLNLDAPTLELAHMKTTYKKEFREAFRAAVGELSARDRNIIRYLSVEGLAVQQIAALYRVNRTTVWRWLTTIKQTLVGATRERLSDKLGLAPDAVDSVLRLIESRLEATLDDVV